MPTLPASSAITTALYTRLATHAPLLALLPDGVWLEVALPNPNGAPRTRFAIVSPVPMMGRVVAVFGRRAYEERVYLVKAVTRDLSPATANQAADLINELLEDTELAATGYAWMTTHRIDDPVETLEVDAVDPRLAWQHRGGHYRVQYALL